MANYINTLDSTWPHSETSIRAAFPQTSFPAVFVPPSEYQVIFPAPSPAFDPITQACREIAPVLTSKGHYEQAWEIYDLDAEQVAGNQERAKQQFIDMTVQNTQKRLDDFAKTRNYDGILSACTYASSSVQKFQEEGQYCVDARDSTWATLYTIMGEVDAGTRPMPSSWADVESLLPVMEWPQ